MSWDTDKEPIDYLRQRVKYYKRKISNAKNWHKNPIMVQKYGDLLPQMIFRCVLKNESYLAMFKKAVKDLETIDNHEPIKG